MRKLSAHKRERKREVGLHSSSHKNYAIIRVIKVSRLGCKNALKSNLACVGEIPRGLKRASPSPQGNVCANFSAASRPPDSRRVLDRTPIPPSPHYAAFSNPFPIGEKEPAYPDTHRNNKVGGIIFLSIIHVTCEILKKYATRDYLIGGKFNLYKYNQNIYFNSVRYTILSLFFFLSCCR